jgi:tetratricopeptide (TPR) repeat protein
MSDQRPFSADALAVKALLDDIGDTAAQITSDTEGAPYHVQKLIKGDLKAARRAAQNLEGDERKIAMAATYFQEANLLYRVLGNTVTTFGKDSLRDAAKLAESANEYMPSPHCYILLGKIYDELGDHSSAQAALQKGVEFDDDPGAIEAKKELLRLDSKVEAIQSDINSSRFVGGGCMKVFAVVGVVSFLLALLLESRLPAVSGFLVLATGISVLGFLYGAYEYVKTYVVK